MPALDPAKRREYRRRYAVAHPIKHRNGVRNAALKKHYGITLEKYRHMLKHQNGKCAGCGKKPRGRNLDVDHDHVTDIVRGLLCRLCNRPIGCAKDDPSVLRRLATYLERSTK